MPEKTKSKPNTEMAKAVLSVVGNMSGLTRRERVNMAAADPSVREQFEAFIKTEDALKLVLDTFIAKDLHRGKSQMPEQLELHVGGFAKQKYAVVRSKGTPAQPGHVLMKEATLDDLKEDIRELESHTDASAAELAIKRRQLRQLEHPMGELGMSFPEAMAWVTSNGEEFTE